MLYYIMALIVIMLDQVSKWLIVRNLELYESRSIIGEFFHITSHRNTGAAFGILQDQRWFFVILTVIIVIGIVVYLHKMIWEGRKLLTLALSLLLGGALGNFIDRVRHGEVVDFLQFRFQFPFFGKEIDYTFAIFNIADSAISIGVILVFIDTLVTIRREKRGLTS